MLQPIPAKAFALIPRLASDADGEVINTVRAIERQLKAAGLDWHDLVARLKAYAEPPRSAAKEAPKQPTGPGLIEMAAWLRLNALHRLRLNARDFVVKIGAQLAAGGAVTQKQEKYLRDLYRQHKAATHHDF